MIMARRATMAASHEVMTKTTQISLTSTLKPEIWICRTEPKGMAKTSA